MAERPKNLWFKSKTYGYGWVPATWQGWVVVGVYSLYTFAVTMIFVGRNGAISDVKTLIYLVLMALGVGALILTSIKKGEPAHWQWGDKHSHKDGA